MITFKKLTYKNFLSTGNNGNTLYLDRRKSILVTGSNGAGKSTILDALCYVIFNKPFRNIKKEQLINTVNERGMYVELEFLVNTVKYKIIRGEKPGLFEIYRNGELLNQDAANKDYQKRLEGIMKLNYKSFTQIVILGSAAYQKFMEMKTKERRIIIEDMLDISIFTRMNDILKQRKSDLKIEQNDNVYMKELNESKISTQQALINNITNRKEESSNKVNKEIERTEAKISLLAEKITKLDTKIETKNKEAIDLTKAQVNLDDAKLQGNTILTKKKAKEERIKFFETHDHCDTCEQDITKEIKDKQISELNDANDMLEGLLASAAPAFKKLNSQLAKAKEQVEEVQKLTAKRSEINIEMASLHTYIGRISVNRNSPTDTATLNDVQKELKSLHNEQERIKKEALDLISLQNHLEICTYLLKDTGIKAKIIKQYLPIMNKLINKNLDKMGASYSFHLNENFEETIKSRYRDSFTYSSFSEGEKLRIDLALMFTWREVSRMKNSVNTNLLIMDEIGDSSLDAEGADYLWDIISGMKDTNVYIISHKAHNGDKFSSMLEYYKDGNFSKIKDSIV